MVLMDDHRTETVNTSPQELEHNSVVEGACAPSSSKVKQQRTCIVSRQTYHKSELLRFVVRDDGELFFDLNQKLPGRGHYIYPEGNYLSEAIQRNAFAKAARKSVKIPNDFMTLIEGQLHQSALHMISLARRSSSLLFSADKIKKYTKDSKLGCYITSSSEDSDLRQTIQKHIGSSPIITRFSNQELSDTIGIENAVHMALKNSPINKKFLKQISILQNIEMNLKGSRK